MDPVARTLAALEAAQDAVLDGDYAALPADLFAGARASRSPNGSTVVSVDYAPDVLAALPASHRHLDLFILEPRSRLGTHFHKRATAHIHVLRGEGQAELDGVTTHIAPGARLTFPAGARHDVRSGEAIVLFVSFQDNPIIQPDGSLDYFT